MNLVFASGFLVPNHLGDKEYFRGAHEAFPQALFPVVPVTGTVEERARALATAIRGGLPAGPIHIIAHSMAGLDARFLLANNLEGLAEPGRVASLSTISTPHRGSPIADLIAGPSPDPFDPRRFVYDVLTHLLHDLSLPAGAIGNLTGGFAQKFNEQVKDVPHVAYFSYAGAGMNSFLLKPGHLYIELTGATAEEKLNDGLVSVASAAWGQQPEPPWPADHLAEVGWDLSTPTLRAPFDHLAAYRRIIARVSAA